MGNPHAKSPPGRGGVKFSAGQRERARESRREGRKSSFSGHFRTPLHFYSSVSMASSMIVSPSSSSSSSSSPFPSPPPVPFPRSPQFTPIPEDDDCGQGGGGEGSSLPQQEPNSSTTRSSPHKHQATPLHTTVRKKKKKTQETDCDSHVVNCNKCRPSSREKISVVPLDTSGRPSSSSSSVIPSPSANLLKTLFSSVTGKSPRPSSTASSSASQPLGQERTTGPPDDDRWKLAVADLSRKRDEAVLESSRLRQSMSELEKKLTTLESYCHDLKSALDRCGNSSDNAAPAVVPLAPPFPLDAFLGAVSEARTTVRRLSRSLVGQMRQRGQQKALERISLLLQPYDVRVTASGHHRSLRFYLEALLNQVFYEDFETTGFDRGCSDRILDPFTRCEANRGSYEKLKALGWDEVLSKGTRHYSDELSGFCDRKMSEVVGMLGWTRAWPEPLLQAFFGAAKAVWLVHLLAWAAHPAVPLFRVERGARFDPGYMEDVAANRILPAALSGSIRMMVAPGFYVHSSVIKCKVLSMCDSCKPSAGGAVSGSGSNSRRTDNSYGHVTREEVEEITPLES